MCLNNLNVGNLKKKSSFPSYTGKGTLIINVDF